MLVRFAHCCNPLPGDKIVGYITRGRGVSVHRADCSNLRDSGVEAQRMVEVEWEGQSNASYEADIQIIAYDRSGLLAEVSLMFASIDVPLVAISAHQSKSKQGTCMINLSIIIKNTQQLDKIIRDLAKWPDVI